MQHSSLINPILQIAKEAGGIIMRHYSADSINVERKDDHSPVTIADKDANDYIVGKLTALTPDIPIISEEGINEPTRADQRHFWLVDPLDGTKSFIKHTGEFTVNIALIEDGTPILGAVFIPNSGELFYTGEDGRAYMEISGLKKRVEARKAGADGLVVIASKSHRTEETDAYISNLKVKEFISASSSLKFAMLASGKADCYPRFGTTMEWDTAAGHAVLLAAGGYVENIDGTPLKYGRENFTNPYFIAWGKK